MRIDDNTLVYCITNHHTFIVIFLVPAYDLVGFYLALKTVMAFFTHVFWNFDCLRSVRSEMPMSFLFNFFYNFCTCNCICLVDEAIERTLNELQSIECSFFYFFFISVYLQFNYLIDMLNERQSYIYYIINSVVMFKKYENLLPIEQFSYNAFNPFNSDWILILFLVFFFIVTKY